jgi:zinc/manganese transport system permease protein
VGWLFEPGFFASPEVHTALVIGGVTSLISAVVGVFTVLRGQSFAGHALTEAAATGGAGALVVGLNPLAGFLFGSLGGAAAMEVAGVRTERSRDVATGVVLGASIGFAALFLYLTATTTATSGAPQQILFGSLFATAPSTVPVVAVCGVVALGIVGLLLRPLLLASVHPEMAAARGVPIRTVALAYMVALALAVGLSSIAIGAILSTALLVGPAATALRCTARFGRAMAAAVAIGLGTTFLGVLLAYDSADWEGGHATLPVSFCIVGLVVLAYLASGPISAAARRKEQRTGIGGEPSAHAEEVQCSAPS